MEQRHVLILVLIIFSAIFLAFAWKDGNVGYSKEHIEMGGNASNIEQNQPVIYTKENIEQTDYLDPATTEINVNLEEAKTILLSENSEVIADSVHAELIDDDKFGLIWQISSKTKNDRSILTGIDASTGELAFIYDGSKNVRGNNDISEDQALKIVSKYLSEKVPAEQINTLEFEEIHYREPSGDDLPGIYKINYARKINGVASLNGIQMRVNAETGEVSSYRKTWSINEDEVAQISNEPSITDKEAVRILKDYMSNTEHIGKEKANSVKVTSSELAWKVDEDDKIHLTWWIRFIDSSFADDTYPASVWIDAHSGEMLLFVYARD